MSAPTDWFVYLLSCADGSFYIGIAKDVETRIQSHNCGTGAKYTRGRRPVRLQDQDGPFSHGDALRLEYRLKKLSRPQKLLAFSEGLSGLLQVG